MCHNFIGLVSICDRFREHLIVTSIEKWVCFKILYNLKGSNLKFQMLWGKSNWAQTLKQVWKEWRIKERVQRVRKREEDREEEWLSLSPYMDFL